MNEKVFTSDRWGYGIEWHAERKLTYVIVMFPTSMIIAKFITILTIRGDPKFYNWFFSLAYKIPCSRILLPAARAISACPFVYPLPINMRTSFPAPSAPKAAAVKLVAMLKK